MSTQSQELMTPELAGKIQAYERQLRHWQSNKNTERRGARLSSVLAILFWIVSFVASAQTGVVNQAAWFTAFTFFSFIIALGLTVSSLVFCGFVVMDAKPVKDFVTEKMIINPES